MDNDKDWTREIRLFTPDRSYLHSQLHVWEIDSHKQLMKMALKYNDKEIEIISNSYFHGLHPIRRELEKEGLLLVCYGASRNVWPSGMAESMSRGFRAYKLTLGKYYDLKDLVFTLKEGPDVEPVTLAEQEGFHKQWADSIPSLRSLKSSHLYDHLIDGTS